MNDDDKPLVAEVNWSLPIRDFVASVNKNFALARANGKSIVLPIEASQSTLALLLAQVNCKECDAPCCRMGPPTNTVALTPTEYRHLTQKYGHAGFKITMIGKHHCGELTMPCRFLSRARCTIYEDRPLSCIAFPLQTGGAYGLPGSEPVEAMSLASYCPESKRIARGTYKALYWFKQKIWQIGRQEAEELLAER